MIRRYRSMGWRSVLASIALTLAPVISARLAAATGTSATVVTVAGESTEGIFLGATEEEVTISTPNRIFKLPLREVSYISFVGRPSSAQTVSYAQPASPSSRLRMEGSASERAGRLEEAERKYEEAAKLDPADPLTVKALVRVRQAKATQEASKEAAPFKKMAIELKDARRYGEAAACYEQAIHLDPYDQKFADSLAAMRHYWEPTSCPLPAPKGPQK